MPRRPETCDPSRLDLFLRNRLPGESQGEVENHLLACAACRARLDELAGGPRWWTEVRRYLGSDGATQLWPLERGSRRAGSELNFLQPSTTAGSLGRLGAYEVVEVLGQGGMGIVLKAFDPALHRPVAIKVLASPYAANGTARKRFEREARATAAVIHDHVVPVHHVDADATPPYLVMAFIPGQSLQQRIDRTGPLELKEILRIGMQMAAGLAAAHAQGLVHRDIKPANIMLENGVERVRITDFGLARAVDDVSVTQGNAVAGTPQYMAPEQAEAQAVDQRADLFSLGSTIYAMCTGQAPFRGDFGMAVIRQVCDAEPLSIRSLNPDIPVWLEGIVRKLHAKDPARRFSSAAEVAELLESCLAHVQQPSQHQLPTLARELGRQVPKLPRSGSRRWQVAAAILVTLLVAPVGFWTAAHFWRRPVLVQTEDVNANNELTNSAEAAPWEDVEATANQLRDRVQSLERQLTTETPDGASSLEVNLNHLRRRLESLGRLPEAGTEQAFDPVQDQIDKVRQRLQRVQESVRDTEK
jgi:eukaryotic-like serine/threonine-protein kinase